MSQSENGGQRTNRQICPDAILAAAGMIATAAN